MLLEQVMLRQSDVDNFKMVMAQLQEQLTVFASTFGRVDSPKAVASGRAEFRVGKSVASTNEACSVAIPSGSFDWRGYCRRNLWLITGIRNHICNICELDSGCDV